MKKTLSMVLALLLALTALPALAGSENFNPDGEYPLFKEKVNLTIGVPQSVHVEDFNTNWMTTYIEELANADITFEVYTSEMNTQLTMAITGGSDLPDILFTSSVSIELMDQWASAGALVPLGEYYEKYGYYVNDAKERTGVDFLQLVTSPDGEIYTLPGYNQSLTNECPDRIWIYRPWLEALGLEEPTNAEELYTVLKAFKEQDPNGNGQADEIPMISIYGKNKSWWRALMNMFQYTPANDWTLQDGKVIYAASTEAYREGLKYIRKLFDEGLIDPMSFTIDREQVQALASGETCLVGMNMFADAPAPYHSERALEYTLLSPFKNAGGKMQTTYSPSQPMVCGLITTSCEDPESAFRFCDLLYRDDMSIINHWGQEGVHWEWAQEGDKSNYDYLGYKASFRELESLWGTVQNVMWAQSGPWVREFAIAAGRVESNGYDVAAENELTKGYRLADYIASYPAEGEYVPTLVFTEAESDQISMILSDLTSYIDTARTNFMMNNEGMDINSDESWNAYLAQLDAIGMQTALPILQAAYDRMYVK